MGTGKRTSSDADILLVGHEICFSSKLAVQKLKTYFICFLSNTALDYKIDACIAKNLKAKENVNKLSFIPPS